MIRARMYALAILAALVFFMATGAFAADVTVKVNGFRNEKGSALVYLWNGPPGFPTDPSKAMVEKSVKIEGTSVTVVFKDVKPGAYAASVTHDENGNGKMDTGFMGKPKEGYGASNNPKTRMRAPRFDEAKFTVEESGKTVEIQLKY